MCAGAYVRSLRSTDGRCPVMIAHSGCEEGWMRHTSRLSASGSIGRGLLLPLLLVALLAAGWVLLRWAAAQLDQPGPAAQALRIQVAPGARLRSVLGTLQREGALRSALAVELSLRLRGHLPRIQAGLYEIAAHASARQIVAQLAEGRVLLSSITIVEGWTVTQMRALLDADADVQHDTRTLSDAQLMQLLGHPGEAAEGRFFPDTYHFAAGSSDRRILEMAYERMQITLQSDWRGRDANLPFTSPAQALTLASIIEKETGRADERPRIAAVFVNRLRK